MLRRKPTAITLTAEDIAIYEDARAREAQLREEKARVQALQQTTPDQASRGQNRDPQGQDRARAPQVKTREERLGLGNGGGSRG